MLWSDEKEGLKLLLTCFFVLPLVWFLYVTDLSHLVLGDDILLALPRVKDFLAQGGDWHNLLYRADILGGVVVADYWGKNFLFPLASFLGLSAIATMNFMTLVTQTCFAFLATQSALLLARSWKLRAEALNWPGRVSLVCLFGFLPVLCARFKVGHLDLLLGLLLFLCLVTMILSVREEKLSFLMLLMVAVSLALCIPSHGHQSKLYGIVFGFPVLLALAWPAFNKALFRNPYFYLALSIVVGACAIGLPKFAGMWEIAHSTDASRALSDEMVRSLITFSWHDLWVSLPLNPRLISSGREELMLTECAYAFGPFLLLVFALRRNWLLACGLAATFVSAIGFGLMLEPIFTGLVKAVPPLGGLRVPLRALMPFTLMLPIVSGAVLLALPLSKWSTTSLAAVVSLLAVLVLLPAEVLEFSLWGAGLFVLWAVWMREVPISKGAALVVLATCMLLTNKAWLSRLPSAKETIANLGHVGEQITRQYPELSSPLNRVSFTQLSPVITAHTPLAMGLSNLTGYWNPQRRFREFLGELMRRPFPKDALFFIIPARDAQSPILRELFHVKYEVALVQNQVRVQPLGETLGAAWFPHTLEFVPTIKDLARELNAQAGRIREVLQTRGLTVQEDPKSVNVTLSPACQNAQVKGVRVEKNLQTFVIDVASPDTCALTVSTNYAEILKASAGTQALTVFPIFATLTGILVPQGEHQVVLQAVPAVPLWSQVAAAAGFVLVGSSFAGLAVLRRRRPQPAQKAKKKR